MPELQVVLSSPEDSFTFIVIWIDENYKTQTVEINVEVQKQIDPRLIGVRVAGRPVYLASSDVVYHATSPAEVPNA